MRVKKNNLEEIFKTRRANLRQLARAFRTRKDFALEIGITEALLMQISGDNSVRTIHDALARQIEKRLDIPAGCLDSPTLF
jgi:predicted component of type VI protein secretion system